MTTHSDSAVDPAWICEACCEETDDPQIVLVGGYEVTYCPGCAPEDDRA
jgi:ribosome-binding protein aMBF1 (putative translation factor)